jgi:DDE superfamily endonuclease
MVSLHKLVFVYANARISMLAVKWPGATNDITCFRETKLFEMICDGLFPPFAPIVADEAYSGLSKECREQILYPFSGLQLTAAQVRDEENMLDWESHFAKNPNYVFDKPESEYWKMRAFNFEISSERITVERVLGMLVLRFDMLWKAIEIDMLKVLTIFRVMCKLHNFCIDRFMQENPVADAHFNVQPVEANILPLGNDEILFRTFDVTRGLVDVGEQPTDEEVMAALDTSLVQNLVITQCENRTREIGRRQRLSMINDRRKVLTDDLYRLGIRYSKEQEIINY